MTVARVQPLFPGTDVGDVSALPGVDPGGVGSEVPVGLVRPGGSRRVGVGGPAPPHGCPVLQTLARMIR
jgi:hypothetical protein